MPATIDAPPPKAPDTIQTTPPPAAPPPAASDKPVPFNAQDHAKKTKQMVKDAFNKPAVAKDAPPPAEVKAADATPPKDAAPAATAEPKETKGILDAKADEAAAPADAAPEEFPESKIKLADNASEPARKNFAELRKITDSLRQELATHAKVESDLKQELETFKSAAPVDSAAFTKLQEEHKAMSDRLAVLDLKEHPDFHRQFTKPIESALSEANEIIAYNGVEGADLNALLSKPRKDFNAGVAELTKDMNSMDATTVQAALRQAYKLSDDSKSALAQSQELAKAFREKSAHSQKQAFEEVAKNLGPTGAFLTHIPDDPEWSPEQKADNAKYNASIAEQRVRAERYAFGALTPKEQALVAHKAAIADHLTEHLIPRAQREYNELRDLNRQLVNQIKTLKAAKATGTSNGDPKTSDSKPAPTSIKELVAQTYGQRRQLT